MKQSYVSVMKTKFIYIYLITSTIILIVANLQYISIIETDLDTYCADIPNHQLYLDAQVVEKNEHKNLVRKIDILNSAIFLKKLPIYPTIDDITYKMYYTTNYKYIDFIIRPLVALTLVLIFIYFFLNTEVKNFLLRLNLFERFLHGYLEKGNINKEMFTKLKLYDDEICKLSLETKKLIEENIKINKKQIKFFETLAELNEVVLELSDDFKILEYNKPWLLIEQNDNNFLKYLNAKSLKVLTSSLDDLKDKTIKEIILLDNLNMKDTFYEIKVICMNELYGVFINDISVRHKKHQETKYMSLHDLLTNLPNRTLFMDRLNKEIKKAKRDNKSFAVVFLDLNRFKEINDEFGHEAGDTILIEFAKRLNSVLRDSDTLSRYGGDEFLLILSDIINIIQIEAVVDKIYLVLQDSVIYADEKINMSTSIGVSFYPEDGKDCDTLILKADNAMYKAKKNKMKYCKYKPNL